MHNDQLLRFTKMAVSLGVGVSLFSLANSSWGAMSYAQLNPYAPNGSLESASTKQTLGSKFKVGSSPIRVTALGVFDYNADGLKESHEVGLWKADGTLLASVSISDKWSPLPPNEFNSGGFQYESLPSTSDIVLNANEEYMIGAAYSGLRPDLGDYAYVIANATQAAISSHVTLIGPRSAAGASLTFPNVGGTADSGFFAASFQFTAVPEPAMWKPLLVMTIFVAATTGVRLRRKKQAFMGSTAPTSPC